MLKDLNPYVRFIDKAENVRQGHETIARDCRFIYILEGACDVTFDGKRHHTKAGDAVYLPPCESYTLRLSSASSLAVVHFDLSGARGADDCKNAALPFAPFERAMLVEEFKGGLLLASLEKALISPSPYAPDRASCLMKEILLLLAEEKEKESGMTALTRKILDYVNAHFAEAEITNQEIAARFGYHPYHISRVMRKETGKTLKAYIIWYRLQIAAKMLSLTDSPIADVAHASGFESQSYFSKMFREEYGVTPGEYRKAQTREA